MTEAQTSTGPYTWDDFVALDEDDLRELIDGELVEVEVPTKLHEYIVWMLAHYLAAWALPRKAGIGVVSGFKVRITERRGVMPDLQFFRSANPAARGDAVGLVGPPRPGRRGRLRVEPPLRPHDQACLVRLHRRARVLDRRPAAAPSIAWSFRARSTWWPTSLQTTPRSDPTRSKDWRSRLGSLWRLPHDG